MSLERAKQFFEELDQNGKAKEQLKALGLADDLSQAGQIASIARETGYDVSEAEVTELLSGLRSARAKASDAAAKEIQELELSELDKVAGGVKPGHCSDTYKEDENCWISDRCNKTVNFYYFGEPGTFCDSNAYCEGFMTRYDCDVGRISF